MALQSNLVNLSGEWGGRGCACCMIYRFCSFAKFPFNRSLLGYLSYQARNHRIHWKKKQYFHSMDSNQKSYKERPLQKDMVSKALSKNPLNTSNMIEDHSNYFTNHSVDIWVCIFALSPHSLLFTVHCEAYPIFSISLGNIYAKNLHLCGWK